VPAMYTPMPVPIHDALLRLSDQELRDPRYQARILIEEGLRRRGLLTKDREPRPAPTTRGTQEHVPT
jgi:hypothetical protein